MCIRDSLYGAYEDIRKSVIDLYEDLDIVKREAGGWALASAGMTITADDLSTTTVANDTFTTASQTDYEFDWNDTRRIGRIVLSPGEGVRPLDLRFDMVLADQPELQGTVYAKTDTKLQLRTWNGAAWDASAWGVGWTVDMVQAIAVTLPEEE